MKKFSGILAVASIIMIGMISCSKTGDTGPAGPAGPVGPDSVITSAWIPLAFTLNTANNEYEDTLIAPSITKKILDSGVILSYVNFPETNGTYHVVAVSSLSSVLLEDYTVGHINIIASSSTNFNGLPYRYVTIPGSKVSGVGAKARVGAYTVGELKTMPFEQVQKALSEVKN